MVHKETDIQFLDINEGKNYVGSVEYLFRHYAHKMRLAGNHEEIIFDESDNVKISDWRGWTQLLKIERFVQSDWYHLIPNGSTYWDCPDILVSSDTLVPVYENENPVKGFHGETKFAFQLKKPETICNGDKVRFTKLLDTDKNLHQFSTVAPVYSYDFSVGYKIYTMSNFFNAGVYHLYAGKPSGTNLAYK